MADNDLHVTPEGEDVGDNLGEQSTPNSEQEPQKTASQLEVERSRAVAEMHKFMQKEKEARAQNSSLEQEKAYLQVENAVLKDNSKIVDVYNSNPELAEEICQNNFGVSYNELIQASKPATAEPDLESLLERKLTEREQRQVQKQIDEEVISFFVEKGLTEKSSMFQQVMREYQEYPAPKSVAQAKKLVSMLYREANGDDGTTEGDINAVRSPASSTRTTVQQRQLSPQMKQFMEAKYGADAVKKFLSSK
jgi:hypothetical protein